MKRFAAISALAAVFSAGLVSTPAHAAPTVSWSTETLDWQLIDNPETVAVDTYTRPKATITYQWSQAADALTDCVAWHVDGNPVPAFTTTLSNVAETRTQENLAFATGTYTTEIVYDWTELTEKLSLNPSTTHDIEVQVHNVDCSTAEIPGGSTVTGSDTIQLLSAPSATPQGWNWSATLGLAENVANSKVHPDLGGAANGDEWIYAGENATFTHTWVSSYGTWDGPVSYLGEPITSKDVCVIDVVNQDDTYVDPESANTARGYDYMNIGYVYSEVYDSGENSYGGRYDDPAAMSSTKTYAWNSLMTSGFDFGAYTFDPTQVNSITRYVFQGGCYDTFNYGTASGSSTNSSAPLNSASNWSSTQRYIDEDGDVVAFFEYDYWYHPRSSADIRAEIWAARASAISTETLYLGPAVTSVDTDVSSLARGETVNLAIDWFDGNGQCVAVFVDGVFEDSALAGPDGAGSDSTEYTYQELLTLYSLDNTVEHTIEWRIFGQSCSSIDEATATPAATASVTLEPDESTVALTSESVSQGEEFTLDIDYFDGDNQCVALYIDGVRDSSASAGANGANTSTATYTWDELIADYDLDPSVSHTFEWRIFNGACGSINLDTATPMDSAEITLEPFVPGIEISDPEVGPGGSATLDMSWADPTQCAALFIDDEFISWGNLSDSDTLGSASIELTWQGWVDYIEMATGTEVDLSVGHTISLRLYDDAQSNANNCLSGTTPTLSMPSVDGIDLAVLPLDPNLEASKDSVGPSDESDLDIDRSTYGNLVAAQFIDDVFVGCLLVEDIPETVDWDSLDDTYSRNASHTVTYEVYPIVGDGLDLADCNGAGLAGYSPLTSATVTLTPQDSLAATGAEMSVPSTLGALAAALWLVFAGAAIRRRKQSN